MSRTIFTEEQDNAIRNMFAAGHTDSQIGAHLGLTKGQVVGRRHRVQGKKFRSDVERVRIKPPKPETQEGVEFKRGPGRTEVKRTLNIKPVHIPLPVPTPMGWKHPRGCQWHMGREGLTHLFCGEPAEAGSWCAVHRAICFQPKARAA